MFIPPCVEWRYGTRVLCALGVSASVCRSGESLGEGADSALAYEACYSPSVIPGFGQRTRQQTPFGLVPVACATKSFGHETCAGSEVVYCGRRPYVLLAMLTKWFSLTRLETRTKESNIYASIWVQNPDAQ